MRKRVEIVWEDAERDEDDSDIHDELQSCTLYTVGYLVKWTKKYIRVSRDMQGTDNAWLRGSIAIPISCINEMTELKNGKKLISKKEE